MVTGICQRSLGAAVALSAIAFAAPPGAWAQTGSITGKVTDQSGGAPLEAARVLITGSNRIETTGREGQYTFRNVAPGSYQFRVLRLGYRPDTGSVAVTDAAATLDFAMEAAPVQLDEVVSTATGEQRKLEVGNAVATINAAQVAELAPITEFANLISGRAAGVQVLKSSGTTGTGTRIRIRGSNSISLSNEPLYYLDGIRLESGSSSTTLNIGGFSDGSTENAGPSRINDIVPDDIENIEIVKGPAAATLYGIQASNGVVRITTKHGTAGPPQWNLFSEFGAVADKNTYPLNFYGRDTTAAGIADGFDGFCNILSNLAGDCTQTSLQTYQALNNPATRPYKAGLRQSYGANVGGGSDQVTYFVSGTYENEIGAFRLPRAEEDSVRAVRGTVPDNQLRPNALEKYSVRANVSANVSKTFDVDASLGFLTSNTRFIENDNSFLTVNGSGTASGNLPEVNRGWFYIPAELFAELANQAANRFTGGFTGNWHPREWLTGRATIGYDVVNRTDVQFFPTGEVADLNANRAGVRTQNRFDISQTSVDLGASARFQLSDAVGSRTSVGGQFFRDLARGNFATGRGLPAGSGSITGAGVHRGQGHADRITVDRVVRRGRDQPEAAPLRHRRPALRRQQRLRPELQRDDLSQEQRLLADLGRAVLQRQGHQYAPPPGRLRRVGTAARHHRRPAVLQRGRRKEGRHRHHRSELCQPGQRQPQARALARARGGTRCRTLPGPGVGGAHLLQQAHERRADLARHRPLPRGLAHPVRQPFTHPEPRLRAGHQQPHHRQAQHRLGPDGERVYHEEQDPGAG